MQPFRDDFDDSDDGSLSEAESFKSAFSDHKHSHSNSHLNTFPSTTTDAIPSTPNTRGSSSPPTLTAPLPSSATDAPPLTLTRFPASEELTLLTTSNTHKTSGNTHFTSGAYNKALTCYDEALANCPNYLDYELAVLRSNMAACWLKLREWKKAEDCASGGLERLKGLDGVDEEKDEQGEMDRKKGKRDATEGASDDDDDEKKRKNRVEEIIDNDNEDKAQPPVRPASKQAPATNAPASKPNQSLEHDPDAMDTATTTPTVDPTAQLTFRLATLSIHSHDPASVLRLRTKLTLRRAHALSSQTTWSALSRATEDYTFLSSLPTPSVLSPMDRTTVQKALRELPARVDAAKDKDVAEMMGKLKELGNGILKPFGLSTEMFQFTQDEGSGGYSMQFNQGKK